MNPIPPARPFSTLKVVRPPPEKRAARKMTGKEVADSIRGLADGWSPEAEKALALPPEMYFMRNEQSGTLLYSREEAFGIADFLSSLLSRSSPRPKTEYGIAVYETAESMYFVLVDMRRMIAVREQLLGYNERPPRRQWDAVVKAIGDAERAAEANPGRVAVHDGAIRLI